MDASIARQIIETSAVWPMACRAGEGNSSPAQWHAGTLGCAVGLRAVSGTAAVDAFSAWLDESSSTANDEKQTAAPHRM